ncbi:MAG: hypothetical protein M9958_02125 [Chitinophagales bacterium]|nr:hypothetical protein [Chitinophagales bacterium]
MSRKIQRFLKIDIDKLRKSRQGLPLFVDLIMVVLVLVNLGLIFFDWSYTYLSFKDLLALISPTFNQFYAEKIHPNTSYLDLIFVSIFILELLIRWGLSIYRKVYDKWFFYPFIHWYDVLGCIPMNGTFKLFRLFRILGMILRLNTLGIIDIKSTYLYKKGSKYLKIGVEELSDKVVINVLNGVQEEIHKNSPLIQQIAIQIIEPQKEQINTFINHKLSEIVSITYYRHRNDLYKYLQNIVHKSIEENPEIQRISLIPGVGKLIAEALDSSISNITFNVIDNSLEDISKSKKIPAVEDITQQIIESFTHQKSEQDLVLQDIMKGMTHETIGMIIKHIEVKQWKINELNADKARLLKKLDLGRGNTAAIKARIEIIENQISDLQKISLKSLDE